MRVVLVLEELLVVVVVEDYMGEEHYNQDHNHTQVYHTLAGKLRYAGIQVCRTRDRLEVGVVVVVWQEYKVDRDLHIHHILGHKRPGQ